MLRTYFASPKGHFGPRSGNQALERGREEAGPVLPLTTSS